ncbi:MAG: hypothetical protein CO103_06030 [Chloroflexi bacterium CG_4_9_14_3_um_filter_45_9]|nr:MAG: hypothetical protein AUK00_02315 [Dehalococcoidia bacterium CG2_30_46_9]PIU22690.1 MAG: hypothetical protein COT13_07070 [Chloroflexi bacterium CG08_land_8_20_14_0_20_45_12]PIX26830.1 MAG: hypothetical protein COZ67_05565 [Chloroflexi bacterium CG_4_8_14_3_um_filter_45_15]PJB49341.1 MAG: hypothetical protein CO103_06030 [Chloroflexi bacterium CG_4_9_14_3_um_filter_45_9]
MPTYEYVCLECQEKAEIRATISEKEKGLKVTCPKCGSNNMIQVFGNFMVMSTSCSLSCRPTDGSTCCG